MELSAYISFVRRWIWLIALVAVITGSIGFLNAQVQLPQYKAETTIRVGNYLNLANPDSRLIQTGQDLALTYGALLTTYPILTATIDNLKLPFTHDGLRGLIRTRVVPDTTLLVIEVNYTDPILAASIADELARQLIQNSPTNLTQDQIAQQKLLQAEIANAQAILNSARERLSQVESRLLEEIGAEERARLEARRDALNSQINASQANLAQLSNTLALLQQQGTVNVLTVVEPARIPTTASTPPTMVNTLLAALVGALITASLAFLYDYFNDSIRSPAEIFQALGVPVIGTIGPFGKKRTYRDKLIAWTNPLAPVVEAYRAIRVNLMRRTERNTKDDAEHPLYVFIITSPTSGEGKSVTAANLAVTFAQTGMRVLLVDADLRRATQHLLFGVPNDTGLSDLLSGAGKAIVAQAARVQTKTSPFYAYALLDESESLPLSSVVTTTAIPNLALITAGPAVMNPNELLSSARMDALFHELAASGEYDVILFDTPPTLSVSDAYVLADVTKGSVILVLRSGRTRRAAAARAMQQLSTLSIPLAGIVLNGLNSIDAQSGYSYSYYGYGSQEARIPMPLPPSERVTLPPNGYVPEKREPPPSANGSASSAFIENHD